MSPEELSRFRLRRVLGRGERGEVWAAEDTAESATVAVKILRVPEEENEIARAMFVRDTRIAAFVRHPNYVAIHDGGEAAGTCFLVMDLVEGRGLSEAAASPDVALETKVRWLHEVAAALASMHEHGVVHRDVKPKNVLVRADGTACLVDLGMIRWSSAPPTVDETAASAPALDDAAVDEEPPIASSSHPALSARSTVLAYVAPEARHDAVFDEAGDQWAWGRLASEVLADTAATPALRSIASRASVDTPADRFRSMADVCAALEKYEKAQARRAAAGSADGAASAATHDGEAPASEGANGEEREAGSSPSGKLAIALAIAVLVVLGVLIFRGFG